jgi:hypothetical protein
MDMGFAVIRPLARHRMPLIRFLFIGSHVCSTLRIPGQGGHDSEIDPVSIPKLIRSRFRDEVGQGFRF